MTTPQTNEELIKDFKNHLDYYKDLKDKWEFLKTPEDRAFHAGKTQGMLLGLEVIERISIPQPEQLEVYLNGGLGINGAAYAVDYINPHGDPMCLLWAKSKQEALDFAMKYNLKVTNEEKE